MQRSELQDKAILIVEDEPVIAMDLAQAFERAGAAITVVPTLHHALTLVEDANLAAAVVDHWLTDGDTSSVCNRLVERCVPFVVYSGAGEMQGACARGVQLPKPQPPDVVVEQVARLLREKETAALA